ncbi:MAG: hypothetical protein JW991_03720 [Candidatus Pacebacteria bacterium]|nr:hypothetical protein [Candidatus Paceibacterota bacterium]
MKKTYLLADSALAYLLQVALSFQKPYKEKIDSITYRESSLMCVKTEASLATLASVEGKDKLFTLKTMLGFQTVTRLKEQARNLKQKVCASQVVGGSRSNVVAIASLLHDAEQLSKYADSLSKYK